MKVKRLEFEDNAVAIEGMTKKEWEIFREGVLYEGNADSRILFRFIAGAPGEFMADCVGSTEQENQTIAMMAYIEEEFMEEMHKAVVVINAKFWEYFVYPMITLTGDWSDQTRKKIADPYQGFWPVVDNIIAAWKEVK